MPRLDHIAGGAGAMGRPFVSVCITTYNQKGTIGPCIQSLLDQREGLDLEIIVGDDASSDGTQETILGMAEKHPGIIFPVLQPRNTGGLGNFQATHSAAKGDFVAHLDGDDLALPGKLQAQADYLARNPDCVAVVHKMILLNHEGERIPGKWPESFNLKKIDLAGLVRQHPIFAHSSLMYRKGAYAGLLSRPSDTSFIDFYIYVHLAAQGLIGVVDQDLGAYRCGIGVSSRRNLFRLAVDACDYAKAMGVSEEDYAYGLARQYVIFAQKAVMEGDLELFRDLIARSWSTRRVSWRQRLMYSLRRQAWVLKWLGNTFYRIRRRPH